MRRAQHQLVIIRQENPAPFELHYGPNVHTAEALSKNDLETCAHCNTEDGGVHLMLVN